MSDDKTEVEVALKYMDLARAEILEKTKVVNQTLGLYLAGSAGLASWFYQAVYKPEGQGVLSATEAQKASAALALAVIISYLALAVDWIIYHNERIIAALAVYQRTDLYSVLRFPPMWEVSTALRGLDDLPKALGMVLIEQLIVLAPPAAVLMIVYRHGGFANLREHPWLAGATLAANVVSLVVAILMCKTTLKLRPRSSKPEPKADASTPSRGVTSSALPSNSNASQHNSLREIQP